MACGLVTYLLGTRLLRLGGWLVAWAGGETTDGAPVEGRGPRAVRGGAQAWTAVRSQDLGHSDVFQRNSPSYADHIPEVSIQAQPNVGGGHKAVVTR